MVDRKPSALGTLVAVVSLCVAALAIPGCRGGFVPDISIRVGTQGIASGGTYTFTSVQEGSSGAEVTFVIQNAGLADLVLEGPPYAALGGAAAADFEVIADPPATVPHESTAELRLCFSPTSAGEGKQATLTISSNDPDTPDYTITLTGDATALPPAPDINVTDGTTDYPSGGTLDFGSAPAHGTEDITLTIQNLGTAALNLTGTAGAEVAISGTNASNFSITAQPAATAIAAAASTTFTVRFDPAATESDKTATLTIANDDADEAAYTLTLTGHGEGTEIRVTADGTEIASNGTFVCTTPITYYTYEPHFQPDSLTVSFLVDNTGQEDLTISSVVMGGTDEGIAEFSQFYLGGANGPALPLVVGPDDDPAECRLVLGKTETDPRTYSATVTIGNDDADESTYVVTVTWTFKAPKIVVDSYADGGTVDFGSSSSAVMKQLTIRNSGNVASHVTAGSPASPFSGGGDGEIQAGQTMILTVVFDPAAVSSGTYDSSFTITSSAPDPSYLLYVTGKKP